MRFLGKTGINALRTASSKGGVEMASRRSTVSSLGSFSSTLGGQYSTQGTVPLGLGNVAPYENIPVVHHLPGNLGKPDLTGGYPPVPATNLSFPLLTEEEARELLLKQIAVLKEQLNDATSVDEDLQGSKIQSLADLQDEYEVLEKQVDKLKSTLSQAAEDDNSLTLQALYEGNESLFITEAGLKALEALQKSRVEGPFQNELTPEMKALELVKGNENLPRLLQASRVGDRQNLLNALQLGQIYRDYEAKLEFFTVQKAAQDFRAKALKVANELSTEQDVNQDLRGQLQAAKDDKAGSTVSLQAINTQLLDQYKTLIEAVGEAEKSNSTSKDSPSSEGGLNLVSLGRLNQSSPLQLSEQAVTDRYQIKEEDSVQYMIAKNRDLAQLVARCQGQINAAQIEAIERDRDEMVSSNSELETRVKQAGEEYTSTVEGLEGKIAKVEQQNSDLEKMLGDWQSEKFSLEEKLRKAIEAGNKKDDQIKSLNSSYKDLQGVDRDLQDAKSELEYVQNKNKELQEAVTTAENTSKAVEAAKEKAQETLLAEKKELIQTLSAKEAALQVEQSSLSQSMKKQGELEKELASLQSQLATLRGEKSSLQEKNDGQSKEVTALRKQIETVKSDLQKSKKASQEASTQSQQAVEKLTAEKKRVKGELKALGTRLQGAQQALDDQKKAQEAIINSQQDEIKVLTTQLTEQSEKAHEAQEVLQKEFEAKINVQNATLEQSEKEKEASLAKISELTKASSDKDTALQEQETSLSQSVEKQGELEKEIASLQSQLATLREEKSSLEGNNATQSKAITDLQNKIKEVESDLKKSQEASQQASTQSQQDVKTLQDEKKGIEGKVEDLGRQLQGAQQALDDQKKAQVATIKSQQGEIKDLTTQLTEQSKKAQEAQTALLAKISGLTKASSDKDTALKEAQSLLSASKQKEGELQTKFDGLQSQLAELNSENSTLQTKLDTSEQSNNKIVKEQQSLAEQLKSAQDQVSSLTDEIATLTEKYESQVKDLEASQTKGVKQGEVSSNLIKALGAQVKELTTGKKGVEEKLKVLSLQLQEAQEASDREQVNIQQQRAQTERERDFAQGKLDIFQNPHWSEEINSFVHRHSLGSLVGESRNNVKAYLQNQAVAKVDFQAAEQRSEEAESSFKGAGKAFDDFFAGYKGVRLGDMSGASGDQPVDNTQTYLANFKETAKRVLEGGPQQGKKRASGLSPNFFSDPEFSYQSSQNTFDRYITIGEIKGKNKREDIKPFDRDGFQAVSLAYHNAWQEKLAAKSALENATENSKAYDPGGKKETKLLKSIQQDAKKMQAEADELDALQTQVSTFASSLEAAELQKQGLINTNTAQEEDLEASRTAIAGLSDKLQKAQNINTKLTQTITTLEAQAAIASEDNSGLRQQMVWLKESHQTELSELQTRMESELTTLRGALDEAEGTTKLNAELQTRIAELEKQVEEQKSALQKQITTFGDMEGRVSEKYNQRQIEQFAEIKYLKLALGEATEKLEKAYENNTLLKNDGNHLREERSEDLIALQKANKALEAENKALQEGKQSLEVAQSKQKEENEALRMQVEDLTQKFAQDIEVVRAQEQELKRNRLLVELKSSFNEKALRSQTSQKDEQIKNLTLENEQLKQQNPSLPTALQSDADDRSLSASAVQESVADKNNAGLSGVPSASAASSSSKNQAFYQGGVGGDIPHLEPVKDLPFSSANPQTNLGDSNSSLGSLNTASIGRGRGVDLSPIQDDPSSLEPGQDFRLEYARTVKDAKGTEVIRWDSQEEFKANKEHYAHAEKVNNPVSSSSGGGEKTYPTKLADNAYHTVKAIWSDGSQAEKAGQACMDAYLDMMGGIEAVAALYGQTEALKQAKSGDVNALVMNLTDGETAIPISGSEAFRNGARAALSERLCVVVQANQSARSKLHDLRRDFTSNASIGRKPSSQTGSSSSPPFDLRSPSSGRNHRSQSNPHP